MLTDPAGTSAVLRTVGDPGTGRTASGRTLTDRLDSGETASYARRFGRLRGSAGSADSALPETTAAVAVPLSDSDRGEVPALPIDGLMTSTGGHTMRAGNIVTTSGDVSTPPGGAPCSCGDSSVIDLELAPADLAAIQFHPDPVWETVASLGVLAHPAKHPLHRDLLDRVREPRLGPRPARRDDGLGPVVPDHPRAGARCARPPTRSGRWRPSPRPTRTSPAPTWRRCGVRSPTSRAGAAYSVPRLLEDTATALVGYFDRCWRRCGSGSTTSPSPTSPTGPARWPPTGSA